MVGNPVVMVNLVVVVPISRMDTVVFFFNAEVTAVVGVDVMAHDWHGEFGSAMSGSAGCLSDGVLMMGFLICEEINLLPPTWYPVPNLDGSSNEKRSRQAIVNSLLIPSNKEHKNRLMQLQRDENPSKF